MGQLLVVQKVKTVSQETLFHIFQERWTLKSPFKIILGIYQIASTTTVLFTLNITDNIVLVKTLLKTPLVQLPTMQIKLNSTKHKHIRATHIQECLSKK